MFNLDSNSASNVDFPILHRNEAAAKTNATLTASSPQSGTASISSSKSVSIASSKFRSLEEFFFPPTPYSIHFNTFRSHSIDCPHSNIPSRFTLIPIHNLTNQYDPIICQWRRAIHPIHLVHPIHPIGRVRSVRGSMESQTVSHKSSLSPYTPF